MRDRQSLGGREQAVRSRVAARQEGLRVAAVVVDEVTRQRNLHGGFLPGLTGLVLHQLRERVRVRQEPVSKPQQVADARLETT